MARKSRKQIAVEEPIIESVSSEVFSTAIYARLSVENSGKSEKVDVIANQIEICSTNKDERNLFSNGSNAVQPADANYTSNYSHIRRTNLLLKNAESYATPVSYTHLAESGWSGNVCPD